MRRAIASLSVAILPLALASPAKGSMLTLVESSLSISVAGLPEITIPQNVPSVPMLVSSGGGGFTEPAGLFTGTGMVPTALLTGVPLFNAFTVAGLTNSTKIIARGAAPGSNTFYGIHRAGGGLGGNGRLDGVAVVNLLAIFNLEVFLYPVGTTDQYVINLYDTVVGTGWTTGDVTITGLTTGVTPVNTLTFGALGFDNRNPAHRGFVHLVSPFKVISSTGNLAGYALQRLTFVGVPEPGTLVLLGCGVAGLVLQGLRKRRR